MHMSTMPASFALARNARFKGAKSGMRARWGTSFAILGISKVFLVCRSSKSPLNHYGHLDAGLYSRTAFEIRSPYLQTRINDAT